MTLHKTRHEAGNRISMAVKTLLSLPPRLWRSGCAGSRFKSTILIRAWQSASVRLCGYCRACTEVAACRHAFANAHDLLLCGPQTEVTVLTGFQCPKEDSALAPVERWPHVHTRRQDLPFDRV